jgi:hypothetical protein
MLIQIHSRAADVKLLVTSRHRLQLQGEWVLEVKGLEYPRKWKCPRATGGGCVARRRG